jgi:DNA replication regulator DPB11
LTPAQTQYAEYATQMGAEHKLDLYSDVTHLLVGDTNTLKYQYVAREREDVKVLRPEWVEAVRLCWMNDERVDLNELDARYKLPTFAGLKMCITGFDDSKCRRACRKLSLTWLVTFRAQLQKTITDNGGEYSGDLTKDVTHLVAHACEGKKFQYATQWEKKIVSLKWLKDSLERGMQLDETSYHPGKPPSEQGIGAWNREAKLAFQAGKRSRPEQEAPEPPRKLRWTASARLGCQNETLWGDIVAGGGFETSNGDRESLRPTKSMPVIPHQKYVNDSFADKADIAKPIRGFFSDKHFFIMGFDLRKVSSLTQ